MAMNRRTFVTASGWVGLAIFLPGSVLPSGLGPDRYYFKDDGKIPNNKLPLILYKHAFDSGGSEGASWLEQRFAKNNWTNSWRNGIYAFHHYHSTSHEVLGIYSGSARLHLGGEAGEILQVAAGDVIIIPAGVGHKNLGSQGLGVVGAYPDGRSWDLNRGLPGERPQADKNIVTLPIPDNDPLLGPDNGIKKIWR